MRDTRRMVDGATRSNLSHDGCQIGRVNDRLNPGAEALGLMLCHEHLAELEEAGLRSAEAEAAFEAIPCDLPRNSPHGRCRYHGPERIDRRRGATTCHGISDPRFA